MARWIRRLAVAAAITVPLQATINRSPVAADAPNGAEVVAFTAHTTALTPVMWVGGSGSYSLQQDACVGMAVTAGIPQIDPACSVSASGSYVNTVCGTGTLSGTATVVDVDTYTGPFTVTFVNGLGVGQATLTNSRDGSSNIAGILAQLTGVPMPPGLGVGAGVCAAALNLAAMLLVGRQAAGPGICVFKNAQKGCQFNAGGVLGNAIAAGVTGAAVTVKMQVFDMTAGGGDLCAGQAIATDAQARAGQFKVGCNFPEVAGNRYKVQLTDGPGALNANADNWLGGGAG
jgi:hypothetical protein